MTRNCLNVMQKYANMDKEAGAWANILSSVYRRFPNKPASFLRDLAGKLYSRRASRALIRREGAQVQRALNTLANPAVPGNARRHATDIVSNARFHPADTNRMAHAFNQQFNGPKFKDANLPDSAFASNYVTVPTETYVRRNPLMRAFSSRKVIPTGVEKVTTPIMRAPSLKGNAILPSKQSTDTVWRVSSPRTGGVSGMSAIVSPNKPTEWAPHPKKAIRVD